MSAKVKALNSLGEIACRDCSTNPEVIAVKDWLEHSEKPALQFECDSTSEAMTIYKRLRRYFWERRRSCQIKMRGRYVYAVREWEEKD